MLTRKPPQIESWPTETKPIARGDAGSRGLLTESWTKPPAPHTDIFPPDIQTAPSAEGALIPREKFARVPVPDGFDSANLSTINKGGSVRKPGRYE